jgi:hypothetical protein
MSPNEIDDLLFNFMKTIDSSLSQEKINEILDTFLKLTSRATNISSRTQLIDSIKFQQWCDKKKIDRFNFDIDPLVEKVLSTSFTSPKSKRGRIKYHHICDMYSKILKQIQYWRTTNMPFINAGKIFNRAISLLNTYFKISMPMAIVPLTRIMTKRKKELLMRKKNYEDFDDFDEKEKESNSKIHKFLCFTRVEGKSLMWVKQHDPELHTFITNQCVNVKKYNHHHKSNLFECNTIGGIESYKDQPGWEQEVEKLLYDDGYNLEWIKKYKPELYNHISQYHDPKNKNSNNSVTLHKTQTFKCTYQKDYLTELARTFNKQLSNDETSTIDVKFKISKLRLFHYKNDAPKCSSITSKHGDRVVRCPCIKFSDGKIGECNIWFNLSLERNVKILRKIFQVESFESKRLFQTISNFIYKSHKTTFRDETKCPKCKFTNSSNESIENLYNVLNKLDANPNLRHPSDITCLQCNYEYCTDCLETHPGELCRGFTKEEQTLLGEDKYQACPYCKAPIERAEGCFAIKCIECKFWSCWSCRTLRHVEHSEVTKIHPHYCITNMANNNPKWDKSFDIKYYKYEYISNTKKDNLNRFNPL